MKSPEPSTLPWSRPPPQRIDVIDLDTSLFLYLNRLFSGPSAALFFSIVTQLGNGLITAALILIPMYLKDRLRFRAHALPMVLAVALSGLVVNGLKPIVNRPRPANYFAESDTPVHTPLGTPSDKSFPSGHTQTAFGAAAYLSCVYPSGTPVFLGLAALTGLSRIALGVHFPSDVLVGALFGIVFSWVGFRIARGRRFGKGRLQCAVLFDIDGTLLAGPKGTSGAGVYAMSDASAAITGAPSRFKGADYAGRTDRQIAKMLIEDAGTVPVSPNSISALLDVYTRSLAERVKEKPCEPLGRARDAVEALRSRGASVGLGTGNVRAGATAKLKSAGLDDLFTPLIGGFGDDGDTRAALLNVGVRALNPRRNLPVVIIGDTPHDVTGAKAVGALCIAVPFGKNDRAALTAAGADVVIDHLDASIAETVTDLLCKKRL